MGGLESSVVLKQATAACPRRAELYYFAARLELSRVSSDGRGGSSRAVKWLVSCVKDFYAKIPQENMSTKLVLTLYRYAMWHVCDMY